MPLQRFRQHPYITALIGVFAAVVLLFLISLLGIILFSESLLRFIVEKKGSDFIGREISINGPANVDWHWGYTHIHAEKLSLKNDALFKDPDMVKIERIDLDFKPLQLLRGKVDISEIKIVAPEIFLERKSKESANWHFPKLFGAEPVDVAAPDNRYEIPIIDHLTITKGHIVFNDAIKKINLDMELDSIDATNDKAADKRADRGYVLSGKGKLQGQDFRIEASGGSLEALRDYSIPFPLRFKLEMGETKVLIDGKFQDPVKLEGVDAVLKIEGESLADIFYLTAIPLPPTPHYTLEGQLTKTGNIWAYRNFKGLVGSSDLSGNLSYDVGGTRGFLTAELTSNVLDAADLGGFIGLSPDTEKSESTKLIPDVPLARERLLATDLDIRLNAAQIEAPNLPFKGMDVRFDLRNGLLKLNPLNLVLADGTVDGSIEIDANPEVPPMTMNLNVRQLNLSQFFKGTRFEATTDGLFGGKVALAGAGASLADVLATSNGELTLIMSGGEISQLLIEASDLDIGQAVPLFFGKDKATRINCGVLHFDVKDGLLASEVFVLDTNDSLLVGDVNINLKDEAIKARLDAKPKDNSLLSLQIPLTIGGTLKDPSVGLDREKTANRSAVAIALGTLITPFASLLAFVEKGDAPNTDCRALIQGVSQP
ncbi:MAG: AsmA family protein [Cellvibrio sp.]|nr:AsmA family protein [Cellvibrio sp.]